MEGYFLHFLMPKSYGRKILASTVTTDTAGKSRPVTADTAGKSRAIYADTAGKSLTESFQLPHNLTR
jgi:hypothetical protein